MAEEIIGHESFPGTDVHKTHAGGFAAELQAEKRESFEILIDGVSCKAFAGERIIDIANREVRDSLGRREIPQVCYHPQLGPIQTCDTCMVEVNGKLARACATVAERGMQVATETAAVTAAQKEAFDRILGNHMLYCTVCDNNNGNCTVHNTTALLGIEHQSTPYKPKPYQKDETHPFYRYDPDQCILCGRCVEACQNVQVNETLSIRWEDEHLRVLWDGGKSIGDSSCVSCGHCVTVCPCNALMEKSMIGSAGYFTDLPTTTLNHMIDVVKGIEPELGYGPILQLSEAESTMREQRIKRTKTVCTYCGVGCSYDVWTKDREILKIEPFAGPANGISTCVKGKFGWDYTNHPDRLRKPLIRDGNQFHESSWDEALDLVARRLSEIKQQHGPDAIGLISSSKCTNEESYLMQKLARAVVGTNNIDNCSRYCQSPATQGLFRTVGYGGDSGSISDIAQAKLVLIVGSNTAESHPVLATRVKRAHKLHGQKLIVSDLRRHEMARRADVFLRPNPGTDLVWLSAVTRYIIDSGLHKQDFIHEWVNSFDEYRKSLEPFTLEFAEKTTGISSTTLQNVAHMIAEAESVCVLWAMGVTQHCVGSDTSTAISNLLLTTGNYRRPGTGSYPLRGHNNVQGASDFGSMPAYLPGYLKINDETARKDYEGAWNVQLPQNKGFDNHEMVDAIIEGKLKAMYLIGEDMAIVDANSNYVSESFTKLDFFVVQECFFSTTCQYADVILPACPALEKDGTFTSTERRIQRLYQVLEPLAESRPDWRIIQDVANKLGANWNYTHPAEIMHECAAITPLFAGVTYDRLEGYSSLQWPVAADGSDQPLLYTKSFAFPDGKAKFYPIPWSEPCEKSDDTYPLHVNNGRLLEHFHEGNMTYRVKGIRDLVPNQFLEISPDYAKELGVTNGRWVKVTSQHGEVHARVLITDRVRGKELYLPLNSSMEPVNKLTSSHTDPATHTPAYKEVAAKIELLPEQGPSPLPYTNHRFQTPTPQRGVEVERKWKRPDYFMPGSQPLVQIQKNNSRPL
ncbi:MAG TPA: formate dehydrogenase subunit alpha [Pseudacidobacterium sp.]|jgi:formate dehydrogenase major subunit|nr:formate dehydrogenase subunit alpha [Pseudacidobacterium sp.]